VIICALLSPDGEEKEHFTPEEFEQRIEFEQTDYSYAGKTSYQGQILRANSLARINITSLFGTPLADSYLQRFRESFGWPAHAILLFDLCRGIELVYAMERAIELLSQDLSSNETEVGYQVRDGIGYGLVEAPRGR